MATVLGELSSVKKALNELKDAVQSNAESIKRQRNRSNESSRLGFSTPRGFCW